MMQSSGKRILQIAHNHPRFHPGGTELTALALHRESLEQGLDSWYLGALDETQITPNEGTQMIALTPDQRESALFARNFIRFNLQQPEQYGFLREFGAYLELVRPDVVHVHHVLNFGLEGLHVLRKVLPRAKIILSIHDFYLICANNGQLYKHESRERCAGPTTLQQSLLDEPAHDVGDGRTVNTSFLHEQRLARVLHPRDRLEHRKLPGRQLVLTHRRREQLVGSLAGAVEEVQG